MNHTCDVCNVTCSSESLLLAHLSGKKHAQKVEKVQHNAAIARRSVFLANFRERADENAIRSALVKHGLVDRVVIDKNSGSYAIVEFCDETDAQRLLRSTKRLDIGNNAGTVKERRVDFDANVERSELTSEEVVDVLKTVNSSGSVTEQLDTLFSHFAMKPEMIRKREEFAEQLTSYLQNFFSFKVEVRIFGSSSTGLGFVDSDLDLNFTLQDEGAEMECDDPAPSSSNEFNVDVMGILNSKPLSKQDFLTLLKSERTSLLNRILNQFRKHHGMIVYLTPVLVARTPIVRFAVRGISGGHEKAITFCELSVQNLLSEAKANFVRDVVCSDVSGVLRQLFFVIKLWAHCNGLFLSPNDVAKSKWNSYLFSLLIISFLQRRKLLPTIRFKADSRRIQGWCVDYEIDSIDLSSQPLIILLKGFFVFLGESTQNGSVFSIRDEAVYTSIQFNQRLSELGETLPTVQNFKMSATINVQDPLELCHNVAGNVSKKALSKLHRVLMFSNIALKSGGWSDEFHADLAALFELEKLVHDFAANTAANAVANSAQRSSQVVVTVSLDKYGAFLDAATVYDYFTRFITEILLLEEVDAPSAKRKRLMEGSVCQSMDEDTVVDAAKPSSFCGARNVQYKAVFETWIGRRQMKRKIPPSSVTSPLQMEKLVSQQLAFQSKSENVRQRDRNASREPFVTFAANIFFDNRSSNDKDVVALAENDNGDQEMAEEASSSTAFCKTESDRASAASSSSNELTNLHLVLNRPCDDNVDEQQRARDLFHFLTTFAPKFFPLYVGERLEERTRRV